MIKAVITDVDGVILGKQQGINFPLPHIDVIQKLQTLRKAGMPIVLCSAKANFANKKIIEACGLNNPHIMDGGAVIVDVMDNVVIEKHIIPTSAAKKIWEIGKENNFNQEFNTLDGYFVPQWQDLEVLEKRAIILGKEPVVISSLDQIPLGEVIKIQQLSRDRDHLMRALQNIEGTKCIISAPHPTFPSHHFAVITAEGISKKSAAQKVFDTLHISFEDAIGIGDSEADWEFMSLCKYVGIMGNAQEKLKELAQSKGEGNYFIGPSVEENGILKIFEHFAVK